ncbi:MAG: hypothetical protein ACI4PQ_02620, partial [Butyricicoccaceae bacterium]
RWKQMMTHCTLCPRACGADRTAGQRGFCGAGDRMRIGRASLHQWEEPCLSGTRGAGTVFFCHCTLRCVYCQNAVISGSNACESGILVSEADLARTFLSLQHQGAHNIDLVTPTHYAPQIAQSIRMARRDGLTIPIVYNCSGYESVDTLRMLDGLIDIYLPDFKYYSVYYSERYSAAPDYFDVACEAIEEMLRQVGTPRFDADGLMTRGVILRHLMLPTLAQDTAQILRTIARRWGDRVLVSLMRQYTPLPHVCPFPELCRRITQEEYDDACRLMSELGLDGFLQEAESVGESFIPVFDGSGIASPVSHFDEKRL